MNIAQELSIVRDNIAEYGMTNITQLEYDAIYEQGRADGVDEFKEKSYDIIEEIIHDSNLEINQQLTIYAQIMVRIDRLEEQMKENKE